MAPLGPWFEAHRRAMPWRHEDLDAPHPEPYAVLVSEMMLQQTQVATVIPYFERWMVRFPDAASLAQAAPDAVHKAWEGLGYYRRARHLQAAAQAIAEHGWPTDLAGLMQLPGLGSYTGAAVASIAFQWPEPALDGNAFRVLARLLALDGDPKCQAPELRIWLRAALSALGPSRITQGLMELGATVCTPTPRCPLCPLAGACEARRLGATARIPPTVTRQKPLETDIWLLAIAAKDCWLLRPPAGTGLLAGLWTWPALKNLAQAVGSDLAADPQILFSAIEVRAWTGWTQVYTHRRERVEPWRLRFPDTVGAPAAPLGFRWVETADLPLLPFGKRDQRLRDLLQTPADAPLLGPDPIEVWRRLNSDAGPAA